LDDVTARRQPRITDTVISLLRLEIVRVAIKLNNNPRCMADEIDNVRPHRRLAAKRQSFNMVRFEIPPEQRLGACHPPAKRLRVTALFLAHG